MIDVTNQQLLENWDDRWNQSAAVFSLDCRDMYIYVHIHTIYLYALNI